MFKKILAYPHVKHLRQSEGLATGEGSTYNITPHEIRINIDDISTIKNYLSIETMGKEKKEIKTPLDNYYTIFMKNGEEYHIDKETCDTIDKLIMKE